MVRLKRALTPREAAKGALKVPNEILRGPDPAHPVTSIDTLLKEVAPFSRQEFSSKGNRIEDRVDASMEEDPPLQYKHAADLNRKVFLALVKATRRAEPRFEELKKVDASIDQIIKENGGAVERIKRAVEANLKEAGLDPGKFIPQPSDGRTPEISAKDWVPHENWATFNQSADMLTNLILIGNIEQGSKEAGMTNRETFAARVLGERSWLKTTMRKVGLTEE
ncbi:MAG: hypothetical protein ABH950_09550 [Candidatus Altiarchaeota archaeon]